MLTHDDTLVAFVNVDVVVAHSEGGKEKLSFLHNKNIVKTLFDIQMDLEKLTLQNKQYKYGQSER